MFSLLQKEVRLDHVNPRMEKHGDEHVPACDLGLSFRASNTVLGEFAPDLRAALYARPDEPDLADTPDHLPTLRFPLMGRVKWGLALAGYSLTYHAGIDDRSDIVLHDVELDRFGFVCMDGGTVEVSFRARCNPEASVIGRLCGVMQSEISCTLVPPVASPVIGGGVDHDD
jgi:hypothetical protein